MNARLTGIMEARRAFARIEPAVREAINDANEMTAKAIVMNAQSRVSVRSGLLKRSIDYSIDKRRGTAKVGIAKGPAFYGHFQEFGTATQSARPFMLPAVESERAYHEQRYRTAGRQIEKDVAAVGGRFL
jgi:HK97 gp10 family phage protein